MLLVIGLLLAAGPAGHRARAERAEALGRMQDAAREFEAAWEEEQAPDLLYHLGLARRKLKQYGKARAAFRAYLRAARALNNRDLLSRSKHIEEIETPALVIWGTEDPYLPVEQAERQRDAFPSARIELLEGHSHWPFIEDPQRVADLVVPFLREQVGTTSA